MKLILALLPLLLCSTALFAQSTKHELVITHVDVIDMITEQPKSDMTVRIEGDRITEVGKTGRVRFPRNAQVIDGRGKYLIPGLWDMHVHFTEVEHTFPMFIVNGVTGVRNMGGDLDQLLRWRSEVRSGSILGPEIITCGPIVDGPQPAAHGPTVVVTDPEEGRKTVDSLKERGADCIKVYDRLPRDAYYAIIEEASKQGIPVVGHVPLSITSQEASNAGQQSIEHLGNIFESVSTLSTELLKEESANEPVTDPSEYPRRIAKRGERMLSTYDPGSARRLFATFVRNKTWQVPTLEFKWAQTYYDDLVEKGDERLKYIPSSESQWWTPEKNFFARYRTPAYINFRKKLFQRELELVRAMHDAGVQFMTGTDLSGAFVFAGFSLHHEMELLVQAGFTPFEALQAATRNPAIFIGRTNLEGTIDVGKIANLVLLDENPLHDIRNTQKIAAVVLKGQYLTRRDLDDLLKRAASAASRN